VIEHPRAHYWVHARSWDETRQARFPVHVATPRLRSAWPRLPRLAAGGRQLLLDARRAGLDLRASLAFLLWLDTASCFGVHALEGTDTASEVFGRHLPTPVANAASRPGSITAVVIAKNERDALPGALRSVEPLVDELVVVDDESTDGTAEIARELGARVITRKLGSNFADQRNAGVAAVKTEWVVCIDADERLEPELTPMLRQMMGWPGADAVFMPIVNLIAERGDAPVHWPDVQARLFRAGLRYQGAVHERVERWRRPMFVPLSGPYIRHQKTLVSQHRSTLLYSEIDSSQPYSREEIASVREELARLEGQERE
jgi:Glycosyl transferase family 2